MLHNPEDELLKILEQIPRLRVLVVGDIILDQYVWGKVDRICPEAPVPVVDVNRTEDRLGGAGNVVRNLIQIGAKVSLCGYIGDDREGQLVLSLLDEMQIEKEGVLIDRSRPTTAKTRVIARSQQVVRIDREVRSQQAGALREALAAVVAAKVDEVDAVIVSDYGKGVYAEPLAGKLTALWNSKKLHLSNKPLVIDPHPTNYSLYSGMSVAKPNRREAEIGSGIAITDAESAFKAARILREKWNSEMMLITLGEGGLVILPPKTETGFLLKTVAQDVFDVSGAGDTVTALFTASLGVHSSYEMAGELANIGAGMVVSEVGTVAVELERLKEEIKRLAGN